MSEHHDSTPVDPGPVEDADAVDDAGSEGVDTLDVAVAELRPALEAILMVSDEPLATVRLASVVGHPVEDVQAALEALAGEYAEQGRGFDLRPVAGDDSP